MLSWPFRPYPSAQNGPLAKSGRPVLIEKTFRNNLGERASILPKCPNSRAKGPALPKQAGTPMIESARHHAPLSGQARQPVQGIIGVSPVCPRALAQSPEWGGEPFSWSSKSKRAVVISSVSGSPGERHERIELFDFLREDCPPGNWMPDKKRSALTFE